MASKFRSGSISRIFGYTCPTLHKGKRWYVDFFAEDPVTNKMRRKRYYISSSLKYDQRKKRAAELIGILAEQLSQGWNPWEEDTKQSTQDKIPIIDCLEKYLEHVEKMDRLKTRQSYRSRTNILKQFITTQKNPIKYVQQFDTAFCNEFLDWIYINRGTGPRTRNNYKGWLGGLSEFFVSRNYITCNPVEKIKKLPQNIKFRKDLSSAMLEQMSKHLIQTDKPFYLACLMQYYTLIRPGELSRIKIRDVSVKRQTVFVSGLISKNHKDAEVGLNNAILHLMIDLGVLTKPGDYYLFGKGFLPNKERSGADQINRRWKMMRKELGWEDCYQFYSLKDTGIRDLANAKGVVIARDQARHSDISTTNKYIQQHTIQKSTLEFIGGLRYDEQN